MYRTWIPSRAIAGFLRVSLNFPGNQLNWLKAKQFRNLFRNFGMCVCACVLLLELRTGTHTSTVRSKTPFQSQLQIFFKPENLSPVVSKSIRTYQIRIFWHAKEFFPVCNDSSSRVTCRISSLVWWSHYSGNEQHGSIIWSVGTATGRSSKGGTAIHFGNWRNG